MFFLVLSWSEEETVLNILAEVTVSLSWGSESAGGPIPLIYHIDEASFYFSLGFREGAEHFPLTEVSVQSHCLMERRSRAFRTHPDQPQRLRGASSPVLASGSRAFSPRTPLPT